MLAYYRSFVGEDQFEEILNKCLDFICYTPYEWQVATLLPTSLNILYVLYPFTTSLHILYLSRTGRSLRKALCRDTVIFEVIVGLEMFWYTLLLK